MGLTTEQYSQIFRYVDGDMSEAERKAFEALIDQHIEIADEISLYKKIQFISESAEQKLRNLDPLPEQKSQDHALTIIKRAREKWESEHPGGFSPKHRQEVTGSHTHQVSEDEPRKVIVMFAWKKLTIAAAIIGVFSLAAMWLMHDGKHPDVISNNKKTSRRKNEKATDTLRSQDTAPEITADPGENEEALETSSRYIISDARRELLYADNFLPDNIPAHKAGPLQGAFAAYESGDYEEAIAAFGNVKPNLISRGEADRKLTPFYSHYYRAQSFMAVRNASKAISELRKAAMESPDQLWRAKTSWFLALAYLKTGELEKADGLLNQLAGNEQAGEYRARSLQLKKQLNW